MPLEGARDALRRSAPESESLPPVRRICLGWGDLAGHVDRALDLFGLCPVEEENEFTLPLAQIRRERDHTSPSTLDESELVHPLDPEREQEFKRGHGREFTAPGVVEHDRVHARFMPLHIAPSVVPTDTVFVTVCVPLEEGELLHEFLREEDGGHESNEEKERQNDRKHETLQCPWL